MSRAAINNLSTDYSIPAAMEMIVLPSSILGRCFAWSDGNL